MATSKITRKLYHKVLGARSLVERLIDWATGIHARALVRDEVAAWDRTEAAEEHHRYLRCATLAAKGAAELAKIAERQVELEITAELKGMGYGS